jgi:hypothetical protein
LYYLFNLAENHTDMSVFFKIVVDK